MNRARGLRVAALVVLVACAQDVLAGLSPDETIAVRRYLDCIDCVIPLDSVRARVWHRVTRTATIEGTIP